MPDPVNPPQEEIDAFVATLGEQEAPAEVTDEQAPAIDPVVTPDEVDPGTTDDDSSDSFRGIDPALLSVLDPQLQAALESERKSIQAEATRKFQEASELRKQFEGIDLDLAKNAVTYMERLADPEFLVAAHQAMTDELVRQGLTKAEASQQAADVLEEQITDDDDYELEGSPDPRIQGQLQELMDFRDQTIAREQEREQADRLTYLANEALKQEMIVRKDNPEWDDEDIAQVIRNSMATGNILKGAEIHRHNESLFAKRLMKSKASIPSSITTPPSSGQSADPAQKWTLEEGHKAAMEALRNIQAGD